MVTHDEMIKRLEATLQQISAIKVRKTDQTNATTAFHNVSVVLTELKRQNVSLKVTGRIA